MTGRIGTPPQQNATPRTHHGLTVGINTRLTDLRRSTYNEFGALEELASHPRIRDTTVKDAQRGESMKAIILAGGAGSRLYP